MKSTIAPATMQNKLQPRMADTGVQGSPKLIERMRQALRARHYSRRTEQTYCH